MCVCVCVKRERERERVYVGKCERGVLFLVFGVHHALSLLENGDERR